ncbi:hypothetical protein C8J57DRAFT_229605 [Mycena rebaudengoi]|nr:hypothetical protein C8J57DRAFT_229605 [Mycena rebaudengoi]
MKLPARLARLIPRRGSRTFQTPHVFMQWRFTINSWPVTYKVAAIHRLRIITFGNAPQAAVHRAASRSSSCLTKLQLRSSGQLATVCTDIICYETLTSSNNTTDIGTSLQPGSGMLSISARAPFLGLDLRAASLCLSAASGSVLSTLVFALRKRVVHLVDPASIAYSRTIDK